MQARPHARRSLIALGSFNFPSVQARLLSANTLSGACCSAASYCGRRSCSPWHSGPDRQRTCALAHRRDCGRSSSWQTRWLRSLRPAADSTRHKLMAAALDCGSTLSASAVCPLGLGPLPPRRMHVPSSVWPIAASGLLSCNALATPRASSYFAGGQVDGDQFPGDPFVVRRNPLRLLQAAGGAAEVAALGLQGAASLRSGASDCGSRRTTSWNVVTASSPAPAASWVLPSSSRNRGCAGFAATACCATATAAFASRRRRWWFTSAAYGVIDFGFTAIALRNVALASATAPMRSCSSAMRDQQLFVIRLLADSRLVALLGFVSAPLGNVNVGQSAQRRQVIDLNLQAASKLLPRPRQVLAGQVRRAGEHVPSALFGCFLIDRLGRRERLSGS